MFFVPTGIFVGTPGLTVGLYIWKGIIPALLGNIVGGGLFVGCFMWYLHLEGQADVAIDGVLYTPAVPVLHGQDDAPKKSFGAMIGRNKRNDDVEKAAGRSVGSSSPGEMDTFEPTRV